MHDNCGGVTVWPSMQLWRERQQVGVPLVAPGKEIAGVPSEGKVKNFKSSKQ